MSYEIVERVAVLGKSGTTTKELNRISYGGRQPVWDLRRWKDGEMLKGITLTDKELDELKRVLQERG